MSLSTERMRRAQLPRSQRPAIPTREPFQQVLGKRHTYLHRDPLQQRVLLDLGDVPHRQANLQDDTAANHYQFRGSPRMAPAGECHGMY